MEVSRYTHRAGKPDHKEITNGDETTHRLSRRTAEAALPCLGSQNRVKIGREVLRGAFPDSILEAIALCYDY